MKYAFMPFAISMMTLGAAFLAIGGVLIWKPELLLKLLYIIALLACAVLGVGLLLAGVFMILYMIHRKI